MKDAALKIGDLAGAIGRGLFAGLAGTAVMTVAQMIEMKITEREGSTLPADGLEKALPVSAPKDKAEKMKLAQLVHFVYGTTWGVPLGMLDQAGFSRAAAGITHFGAVWGTALAMLPKLKLAPPVTRWSNEQILTDALHHAVYAAAAGLTYYAISRRPKTFREQIASEVFPALPKIIYPRS